MGPGWEVLLLILFISFLSRSLILNQFQDWKQKLCSRGLFVYVKRKNQRKVLKVAPKLFLVTVTRKVTLVAFVAVVVLYKENLNW